MIAAAGHLVLVGDRARLKLGHLLLTAESLVSLRGSRLGLFLLQLAAARGAFAHLRGTVLGHLVAEVGDEAVRRLLTLLYGRSLRLLGAMLLGCLPGIARVSFRSCSGF